MAVDILSEPAINPTELSVRMCISSDAVDREDMIIRQEGINTALYRPNPVVLWGHGLEGISLPIAMSEDLEGNLTVTRDDNYTYARAFHNAKDKLSSQFFEAVSSGLIRAASIGITPTSVSCLYDRSGDRIPVVDTGNMNEWSYCAIGVNPEAVLKSASARRKNEPWIKAWALQSEAVQKIMTATHLKKVQEHIGDNAGAFFARVMGRPSFGQCFFNCLMEQHLRGGEIVFGSMGWVREDGSKYYEYGGENFKIVADFTGKTSVYMDDIRANIAYAASRK